MKMKRISLFACALMLSVSGAKAQTPAPPTWQVYTVKDEEFSVAFPTLPAMNTSKEMRQRPLKDRQERLLGSYADGVVYTIHALENPKPRQSLEEFAKEQTARYNTSQLIYQRSLTLNGFPGKELLFLNRGGMVQFFATEDRLYAFQAFGAPVDDARMTKFFSSLSLSKKKDSIEVSDGPGLPSERVAEAESANDGATKWIFAGKEVERKVRLAMKPQPSYTESARQKAITGTVVIKCVFASDGRVTNIRVVSGLPNGLTEKAIDAAKKIKFIPAMKDGRYVSMWMQLEYNFNLY